MSLSNESQLIGMQKVSEAVALTLKEMRTFAKPGMTTKDLDNYGGQILNDMGAKSAPYLTYGFLGWMAAGGLPSPNTTHAIDIVSAAPAMQLFMKD